MSKCLTEAAHPVFRIEDGDNDADLAIT